LESHVTGRCEFWLGESLHDRINVQSAMADKSIRAVSLAETHCSVVASHVSGLEISQQIE